jgi:hypothetical protein
MNKKTVIKIIGLTVAFLVGSAFSGFGSDHKEHHHDAHHENHHHEAHHGGCLNAIGKCEIAHIEVKVEGNVMKCWFVGGGHDTDRAVRIPDREVILSVKLGENTEKKLILQPKPIELAEEKVGDCSYFEGRADWLSSVKKFKAFGKATVKGKVRDVEIHYPAGYDPDHEDGRHHHHKELKHH